MGLGDTAPHHHERVTRGARPDKALCVRLGAQFTAWRVGFTAQRAALSTFCSDLLSRSMVVMRSCYLVLTHVLTLLPFARAHASITVPSMRYNPTLKVHERAARPIDRTEEKRLFPTVLHTPTPTRVELQLQATVGLCRYTKRLGPFAHGRARAQWRPHGGTYRWAVRAG